MTLTTEPTLPGSDAPVPGPATSPADGRPTVLFVDDQVWGGFFQLEAGLRRSGFRTVRVTTLPRHRTTDRLCFDRTVHLDGPGGLIDLPTLLADEHVVDVQVVESLAVPTFRALARIPGNEWRVDWANRQAAVDKRYAGALLAHHGLHVPDTLDAHGTTVAAVVATLGLPVVHKPRLGSGGRGVSVLSTVDEVAAALAAPDAPAHFFERCVTGRHLQFSGVISGGSIGLAVTYETLTRRCAMGPASELRTVDDPALTETGLRVARSLGINGMVNVNVIRDAEGRDWVHDVNPRVWGSCAAFAAVGLDFLAAYVGWLRGQEPAPGPGAPTGGATVSVFPAALESSLGRGLGAVHVGRFLRAVGPYRRRLGAGYAAYESVRHVRRVAYGLTHTERVAPVAVVAGGAPAVPAERRRRSAPSSPTAVVAGAR